MLSLFADVKYAGRALAASPGWTLAAVLCLAIGAGANTTTFSVINGVLLRPLPFPDPRQLVMVAAREHGQVQTRPFSWAEYREVAPQANLFSELSARTFLPVSLSVGSQAQMAEAEFVSENYFDLLRVAQSRGSFFQAGASGPPQTVLSHRLWRARFGGDPSVVGRAIRVNGYPVTVCGVTPEGFVGATQLLAADLWLPAPLFASMSRSASVRETEATPMFGIIGRLKPGVTREQARLQLDAIQTRLGEERGVRQPPRTVVDPATGFGVPPIGRSTVIGAATFLYGLMALLVAVAIANVASLMLARATGRHREMAVRLALGARAFHLIRRILTESILLALAGSGLGILIAVWLPHVVGSFGPRLPEYLSFAVDIRPDWRVLFYAAMSSIPIAAIFGLAPARRAARADVIDALKQAGVSPRTPATSRTLSALVAGQLAVSTILLIGAGLLARTYWNTQAVDPGIDTRNVLAVSIDLDQAGFDATAGRNFSRKLLARVSAMPGIKIASLTREAPLGSSGRSVSVQVFNDSPAPSHIAGAQAVTPDYFRTLHVPLVQGREFTPLDGRGSPVAIVNETMARLLWPGRSPLGLSFRTADGRTLAVAGVVKNTKYRTLSEAPRAVFYEPLEQAYSPRFTLLARSFENAPTLIEAVRREIQLESKDLAMVDARTLDEQLRAALAPARQAAMILGTVCAIGLLLSSVGLFGVVSYSVRERAREIGLRMALGARPRDVLMEVLWRGLRLAAAGLVAGAAGSLFLTRLIASALFGVQPRDPVTIGAVGLVLAAVAFAASYLRARWATRVDPMQALRSD